MRQGKEGLTLSQVPLDSLRPRTDMPRTTRTKKRGAEVMYYETVGSAVHLRPLFCSVGGGERPQFELASSPYKLRAADDSFALYFPIADLTTVSFTFEIRI